MHVNSFRTPFLKSVYRLYFRVIDVCNTTLRKLVEVAVKMTRSQIYFFLREKFIVSPVLIEFFGFFRCCFIRQFGLSTEI